MTPNWEAKPNDVTYAHFGNPQNLNLSSYIEKNSTTTGDPDGHEDPCGCDVLTPHQAYVIDQTVRFWAATTWTVLQQDAKAISTFFHPNSSGQNVPPPPTIPTQNPGQSPPPSTSQQGTVDNSPITSSSGTSKSAGEMASDLSKEAGTNSVPYQTPSVSGHIDLTGKAHFDKATGTTIPTPHVQERPKSVGPNGKVNVGEQTTRAATKQDIRTARKLLKNKKP
jgi:hypothetical protein